MTYPLTRLVDAPSPSATVRYDFNDAGANAPRRVEADSFTLGAPTLDSPFDAVSPMYGTRSLGFSHSIQGTKADALSALAVLSRELLRHSNWLLFQVDAVTRPTWWRIWPSGPEALAWDRVYGDTATGDPGSMPDIWRIPVTLTAEPFGYGERIDLGPYTVSQSSEADTPMRIVLPTIKGDAPVPLRVQVTPGSPSSGGRGMTWATVSTSGSTADVEPLLFDLADDLGSTSGSVTTVVDDDYLFGHYVRLQPTDLAPVTILTSAVLPHRGRYKILLHASGNGSGTEVSKALLTFDLAFDFTLTTVSKQLVSLQNLPGWRSWIDLGEANVPTSGHVPVDVTSPLDPLAWQLTVETADGGDDSDVRFDAMLFIPVDGDDLTTRTMVTTFHGVEYLGDARRFTWDGEEEAAWMTSVVGGALTNTTWRLDGGFPLADPAAEANVLWVFPMSLPVLDEEPDDPLITSIAATWDVTVSYLPEVLHVDGRP